MRKIRTQYAKKEHTQLDELKRLEKMVKKPANIFAGVFGTLSALIMGSGMSLVMTDIGSVIGMHDAMAPGIVIGVAGMMMALVNYPVFKGMLGSRRKKYAGRIIALSDTIMQKKL